MTPDELIRDLNAAFDAWGGLPDNEYGHGEEARRDAAREEIERIIVQHFDARGEGEGHGAGVTAKGRATEPDREQRSTVPSSPPAYTDRSAEIEQRAWDYVRGTADGHHNTPEAGALFDALVRALNLPKPKAMLAPDGSAHPDDLLSGYRALGNRWQIVEDEQPAPERCPTCRAINKSSYIPWLGCDPDGEYDPWHNEGADDEQE